MKSLLILFILLSSNGYTEDNTRKIKTHCINNFKYLNKSYIRENYQVFVDLFTEGPCALSFNRYIKNVSLNPSRNISSVNSNGEKVESVHLVPKKKEKSFLDVFFKQKLFLSEITGRQDNGTKAEWLSDINWGIELKSSLEVNEKLKIIQTIEYLKYNFLNPENNLLNNKKGYLAFGLGMEKYLDQDILTLQVLLREMIVYTTEAQGNFQLHKTLMPTVDVNYKFSLWEKERRKIGLEAQAFVQAMGKDSVDIDAKYGFGGSLKVFWLYQKESFSIQGDIDYGRSLVRYGNMKLGQENLGTSLNLGWDF